MVLSAACGVRRLAAWAMLVFLTGGCGMMEGAAQPMGGETAVALFGATAHPAPTLAPDGSTLLPAARGDEGGALSAARGTVEAFGALEAELRVTGTALALQSWQAQETRAQAGWETAVAQGVQLTADGATSTAAAQWTATSYAIATADRQREAEETAMRRKETHAAATDTVVAQDLAVRANRQAWDEGTAWAPVVMTRLALPMLGLYAAVMLVQALARRVGGVNVVAGSSHFDGDQPTAPEGGSIRLELAGNNGRSLRYVDLPVTESQLNAFCGGLAQGLGLSEAVWTGRKRPFSVQGYRMLRDGLMTAGLARWSNPSAPAQGWRLTREGWELVAQVSGADPTPPPTGVVG